MQLRLQNKRNQYKKSFLVILSGPEGKLVVGWLQAQHHVVHRYQSHSEDEIIFSGYLGYDESDELVSW